MPSVVLNPMFDSGLARDDCRSALAYLHITCSNSDIFFKKINNAKEQCFIDQFGENLVPEVTHYYK